MTTRREDVLAKFELYHPTIQQVTVYETSSSACRDKKLLETVREYEDTFGVNLPTVSVFPKQSVSAIQNSCINQNARDLVIDQTNGLIRVLSKESDFVQKIETHRKGIAEIATCYHPSIPFVRSLYQHHFGALVRILFREFFVHTDHDDDVAYVGPLRAGAFVSEVGFLEANGTPPSASLIHTKRVYFDEDSVAVAIGEIDRAEFLGKRKLVICEGGLVSGLSIVGFLQTLFCIGCLPKEIVICVVHASTYGIMNVLRSASRLGVDVRILTTMTSYAIGRTLYAFYDYLPWKKGTLVTGDIGDYLVSVAH